MKKISILASLAVCAALTAGTAMARDNDHDRKQAPEHHNTVRAHDRDHDRDHDRLRDRREHERRDAFERQRRERERREARERELRRHHATQPQHAALHKPAQPKGWTQGHKTGWQNCNVPPGQARPANCGPAAPQHTNRAPVVRPARDRDHDGDRR